MGVVRLPLWQPDPWYKTLWGKIGFSFFLWRYRHGLLTKEERDDLLEQCRHDDEDTPTAYAGPRYSIEDLEENSEEFSDYIKSLDSTN